MGETFCKFCGQHTDTPCVDETDLHIYSRTVERCADANYAYEAEIYYENAEPLYDPRQAQGYPSKDEQ